MSADGPRPSAGDEERRYRAVAGLDPRAPGALERLLAALTDPSWRVRSGAVERLAEADPARAAPALAAALAADSGAGARNAAAIALERLGGAAVPALLPLLEGPASELRTAALEILGGIGDRRTVPALARRLDDPDPNVRAAAAEALGKAGGPAAVAALHAVLARPDPALRRAALDALIRLRAPPPAPALAELVGDRGARRAALRLAGWSDDPAAAALLAAGLADPSRTVREAALAGIGQQRLRPEPPSEAGAALAEAVSAAAARAPAVAAGAAEGLAAAEAPVRAGALAVVQWAGAAEHAAAAAAAAEDELLRPLAAEALAALGPAAAAPLAAALDGLGPAAATVALSALAGAGDPRALPALVAALATDDEEARGTALEALARLGDPRAVPAVAALLEAEPLTAAAAVAALSALAERGPAARDAALAACRAAPPGPAVYRLLGRLGDARDVLALREGLRAPHRGTRVAAAGALAALCGRAPLESAEVPELLDALDDADAAVRAAAAQALGALAGGAGGGAAPGRGEATRALAAALHDPEGVVRAMAALALGRCRAREYAPHLAALVDDPGTPAEAAAAALHALAELGAADPAALGRALAHPDAEVVKEAVRAAAGLPGPEADALLLAAARHGRWDVRRAAAGALRARRDPGLAAAVRRLAAEEQDPLVADALRAAVERLEGRAAR